MTRYWIAVAAACVVLHWLELMTGERRLRRQARIDRRHRARLLDRAELLAWPTGAIQ